MDVTSQLNLEREAGMGENAERRPAEPASTGGGHGGSRSKTRGGPGSPRVDPGGGRTAAFFLRSSASSLSSLQAASQALVLHLQPHQTHVLLLPPEKQHTPQTTNPNQQITDQIKFPKALGQCSGSLSQRRF